jgi:hypothetical protein
MEMKKLFMLGLVLFGYSVPAAALSPLTTELWVRGGLATKTGPADVALMIAEALEGYKKGAANGVASLDSTGKIPAGQLPEVAPNDGDLVHLAGAETISGAKTFSGAVTVLTQSLPQ